MGPVYVCLVCYWSSCRSLCGQSHLVLSTLVKAAIGVEAKLRAVCARPSAVGTPVDVENLVICGEDVKFSLRKSDSSYKYRSWGVGKLSPLTIAFSL